jgi:magnesium chelatase accessory protein
VSSDPIARVPLDWPERHLSRSILVGKLQWHVQVGGSGPVVLLLHGTGGSSHCWARVVPEVLGHATVVVPDLPGHGFTRGAAPVDLSLPGIAAALKALLQSLQLPAPDLLVGHSAGAALAIRWALDSVQSSAVPVIGFNPALIAPPRSYLEMLAPLVHPIATSSWTARMVARVARNTPLVDRLVASTGSRLDAAQLHCYRVLFANPDHVRGALGLMAAADLPNLVERGAELGAALSLVLARGDRWLPEPRLLSVIKRSFPSAAVRHWEGGHLIPETAQSSTARFILEVLSGQRATTH